MKVCYHSAFRFEELKPDRVFSAIPTLAALELSKDRNEPPYELLYNGDLIDSNTERLPCCDRAELIVKQGSHRYVYSVLPSVKPVSAKCIGAYEQFSFDHSRLETDAIQGVCDGLLKLYAIDQSTEVRDWSPIFDQLDKAYGAFKAICEKPKSHLKSVNEIRPIETVKRVGYESIPYLAAHSEDWLARTASGLKPARLFSRVEEDDYHIYENRLVKTLIDLVLSFLRRTEKELRDQRAQLKGILDSSVQMESFGFDADFQKAVKELISSDKKDDEYRSKSLVLIERLRGRAQSLLRRYRSLRKSKLYRYLKRAKPVTNPVNDTNMLLMERYYSVIFKLWKEMHDVIAPSNDVDDARVDFASTCGNYLLYCSVLCEYAAHVLGFELKGSKYVRGRDHISLEINSNEGGWLDLIISDVEPLSLRIREDLQVPLAAGNAAHRFVFDGERLSWPRDITAQEIESLCGMFKSKESRGKQQAAERRRYASLKQAIDEVRRSHPKQKCARFAILPFAVELSADTRTAFRKAVESMAKEILSRRQYDLVVVGMPACGESEQKLTTYAFGDEERLCLLPLSMFDINSFRRIQNLLYRGIVGLGKDSCPNCGRKTIGRDGRYRCEACGGLILTNTMCPNEVCGYRYSYMSYETLQATVNKIRRVKSDDFFQWDSLYQYKNIVEMRATTDRVRPICPHCGC